MTFVTKMKLQSGDRGALDRVVSEIQSIAARKGAELKGPHPSPAKLHRVSQYKTLSGDATRRFDSWKYTVYTRELEIVGHNGAARQVTQQIEFPSSVHVEAEVEQTQPMGHTA